MKELIDALHVIQNECKKHDEEGNCEKCMLYKMDQYRCAVIENTPNLWEINDGIKRALL